jgi:hypothetical protein
MECSREKEVSVPMYLIVIFGRDSSLVGSNTLAHEQGFQKALVKIQRGQTGVSMGTEQGLPGQEAGVGTPCSRHLPLPQPGLGCSTLPSSSRILCSHCFIRKLSAGPGLLQSGRN